MIPYNLLICDKESCFVKTGAIDSNNSSSNNTCYMSSGEISQQCRNQINNQSSQKVMYNEMPDYKTGIRRRNY